jgi:hypothetical protein
MQSFKHRGTREQSFVPWFALKNHQKRPMGDMKVSRTALSRSVAHQKPHVPERGSVIGQIIAQRH